MLFLLDYIFRSYITDLNSEGVKGNQNIKLKERKNEQNQNDNRKSQEQKRE